MALLSSDNNVKVQISTEADTSGVDKVEKSLGAFSSKSAVIMGAVAGVVQSVANQAFSQLTNSIGDAVSRVDTLNNFPRIMSNFGVSAVDANKMIRQLDMGVRGLPTTLDSIAMLAEGFVPLTKNTKVATDTALALNNAILAGGAPAQVQTAALEQFRQALSKGVPDLQDWKTLEMAMPAQLQQVTEKLGIGKGALEGYTTNGLGLYQAMKVGKLSMTDFNKALVDLNTQGVNGLPNFAAQAKNATQGIGTSIAIAKTAVIRGMADIMQAIGTTNISNAVQKIGFAFEGLLKDIVAVVRFISDHSTIFGTLAAAITGATIAIVTYNTAIKLYTIYSTTAAAATTYMTLVASLQAQGLGGLRAAWLALNIMMAANPIGIVIIAVAALTAALIWFFTQTEIGRRIFQGAMSGIQAAASAVVNWMRGNWPALLGILTNPFGAAVGYIIRYRDQILDAFRGVPGKIAGMFTGLGSHIKDSIGNIKIGSVKLSSLPGFATGVQNFSGGMALVGEQGPEIVNLPRGSSVYTNGQSQQMLSGGSTHTTTIGTVVLQSKEAVQEFFKTIDADTILASKNFATTRGA